MKKLIKKHLFEIILSTFFVCFLMFLDRFNWVDTSIGLRMMAKWAIYYAFMFVLFFGIIFLLKYLVQYLYQWLKKYYEETKNKKILLLFLVVIFTSIFLRVLLAIKHFTHFDDFGVVSTMIDRSVETPWKRMEFYTFWTYAPFQFLFNSGLINPIYRYEYNVFLGRLPSLICGILNILLFFQLVTKIKDHDKMNIALLIVLFIGFSWENIIYSSQMAPYSIGITFVLLMLIKYLDLIDHSGKKMDYITLTLITVLACYAQYQLYIFIFALYASLFFIKVKDVKKKGWKEPISLILCGVVTVLAAIPMLLTILKLDLLGHGITWNRGKHRQFTLKYSHKGILKIYDFLAYIVKNLVICLRSFFVYKSGNVFVNFISICLFLLVLLGFLYTNRKKSKIKYTLFFDFVLFIYCYLIAARKLVLSPSRHSMVLIPIFLYYFIYGLSVIGKKSKKVENILLIFFSVTISFIFLLHFKTEYKNRINPINTHYFQQLIEKYHPISVTSVYIGIFSTNYLNLPGYINHPASVRTLVNQNNTKPNVLLIYDIDHKLRQKDLEEILRAEEEAGIKIQYKDPKKWKILYKKEQKNNTEIEYAYGEFKNYPNSFYCYVVEMEE